MEVHYVFVGRVMQAKGGIISSFYVLVACDSIYV